MSEVSFDFRGKTVLITGGSSNIGRELVKAFASAGANVAFTFNSNREAAQGIVTSLSPLGAEIKYYQLDQKSPESCHKLIQDVFDVFGHVDWLINNSGNHGHTPTTEIDENEWDTLLACNLKGVFFLSRDFAVRNTSAGGNGSIVNISSINSFNPLANALHYSVSKAGINQLTRNLAMEFGESGIRVNAIAPGLIDTPDLEKYCPGWKARYENRSALHMVGSGRDIADLALFLVSDRASWITGQVIIADGGVTLAPAY